MTKINNAMSDKIKCFCAVLLRLPSRDAIENLATEEVLLDYYRDLQEYLRRRGLSLSANSIIALTYVNESCLVLGNNQNIFSEINLRRYFDSERLPICRRISGGGTVYHDAGNLCYSFLSSPDLHLATDYSYFTQPIIELFKHCQLELYVSDSDLKLGDYKVSGNAQVLRKQALLHHGTLLYEADLSHIHNWLKPSFSLENMAIPSRPARVQNLSTQTGIQQFFPSFIEFRAGIENYLAEQIIDFSLHDFLDYLGNRNLLLSYQQKYQDRDWTWRRAANFNLHLDNTRQMVNLLSFFKDKLVRYIKRQLLAQLIDLVNHRLIDKVNLTIRRGIITEISCVCGDMSARQADIILQCQTLLRNFDILSLVD